MKAKIETTLFLLVVTFILITASQSFFKLETCEQAMNIFKNIYSFVILWFIGLIAINTSK